MDIPPYSLDFQAPNPCSTSKTNTQVFFPHPNDNTKFIQCNAIGEMYIIQCPHGKLYNKATVSCVSQVGILCLNGNARPLFWHSSMSLILLIKILFGSLVLFNQIERLNYILLFVLIQNNLSRLHGQEDLRLLIIHNDFAVCYHVNLFKF